MASAANAIGIPTPIDEISFQGWDERLYDEEKFSVMFPAIPRDDGLTSGNAIYFDTDMPTTQVLLRRVHLADSELVQLRARKTAELKRTMRLKSVPDPYPFLEFAYEVEVLMRAPVSLDILKQIPRGKAEMWPFPVPTLGIGRLVQRVSADADVGVGLETVREYYPAKFIVLEAAYQFVQRVRHTVKQLMEAKREELRIRQKAKRPRVVLEIPDDDGRLSPPAYPGPSPPSPPPRTAPLVQSRISPYFRLPPLQLGPTLSPQPPLSPLDLFGRLKKKSRRADLPPDADA